jgi:hypothetical protein
VLEHGDAIERVERAISKCRWHASARKPDALIVHFVSCSAATTLDTARSMPTRRILRDVQPPEADLREPLTAADVEDAITGAGVEASPRETR